MMLIGSNCWDYKRLLDAIALQKNRSRGKDWLLIKALFNELWQVLIQVHFWIYKSSFLEPQFDSIQSQPKTIFCHLKYSLFLDNLTNGEFDDENSETLRKLAEFTYYDLGNDTPMRLVSDKVQPVG